MAGTALFKATDQEHRDLVEQRPRDVAGLKGGKAAQAGDGPIPSTTPFAPFPFP